MNNSNHCGEEIMVRTGEQENWASTILNARACSLDAGEAILIDAEDLLLLDAGEPILLDAEDLGLLDGGEAVLLDEDFAFLV